MPNDPVKAIQMMEDELAKIKEHLKDTEQRKRIRNMMPSIFEGITIRFGKRVEATGRFVDGRESIFVIRSATGPDAQDLSH
jgi:hypothetical protein